jgi:hypothetical protein
MVEKASSSSSKREKVEVCYKGMNLKVQTFQELKRLSEKDDEELWEHEGPMTVCSEAAGAMR